ncbi:TetR/AcrR family transcriptional regulator [Burkholderia lata]|uniref:TetR family transcriptional regulator n=1 Tax=Burkholderia lata (strain ATCC 17760 / DSM 23089 / LMG 22485 / NCIMB 9086 / R18194 / 383) TaxID=482957 RepID=A0A6P2HKI4_BURL3|nr:TetR/AcrR family transcriptional regulator [Burkholderia lata]VWB18343.1 TetR family transcriptional regulator [Burkholderia lata]
MEIDASSGEARLRLDSGESSQTKLSRTGSRRNRVAARDARKAILEAAMELYYSEEFGSVSMERVAERAMLHKMTIYRTFGSLDELVQASIVFICARERAAWQQAVGRFPESAVLQLRELFVDLSSRVSEGCNHGRCLQRLARHFPDATHPARVSIVEHRHEFQVLLLTLATQTGSRAPTDFVDTMTLLWDGVAASLGVAEESLRLAYVLPDLIDRLLSSYVGIEKCELR